MTRPLSSADVVSAEAQQFIDSMARLGRLLAIKLYRLRVDVPAGIPILPCLDHEAMLHEGIAPHTSVYLLDESDDLHEILCVPDEQRIAIDIVSTMFERSPAADARMREELKKRFSGYNVELIGLSWIRGDLRVAKACRAQVALRDVLTSPDLDQTKAAVDRLQTISTLMEKESRVASWAARTVMTPVLALVGFVTYELLSSLNPSPRYAWVGYLRYEVIGLLGGYFLYYGMKAVHLTEMANRAWKRSAEYGLILSERRRLRTAADKVKD